MADPTDKPKPRGRRKVAGDARCLRCDGYGRHANRPTCSTCDGTGRNPDAPTAIRRPTRGRPSKVDTHGPAIIRRIRLGMPDDAACSRSDVSVHTLDRWLAKGYDAAVLEEEGYELPDDRAKYRRFLREYLRAREELHERLLERIEDLVDTMDAREAMGVLERLRSDRWGRRDTVLVGDATPGGRVPFTERYADTLTELLRGVIADLMLTDEQRERVPEVLERNLRRVSARHEHPEQADVGGIRR